MAASWAHGYRVLVSLKGITNRHEPGQVTENNAAYIVSRGSKHNRFFYRFFISPSFSFCLSFKNYFSTQVSCLPLLDAPRLSGLEILTEPLSCELRFAAGGDSLTQTTSLVIATKPGLIPEPR